MNRRRFLELCVAAGFFAAFPEMTGCGPKNAMPRSAKGKALAIINGRVVDVVKGRVLENASLFIEKGRIVSVDFGPAPKPTDMLTVFDAEGAYLIPGLMDAHCHSTMSAAYGIKSVEAWRHYRQLRRQYEASIASGVTTLRDVGAFPGLLHEFIREIESGALNGPRIVFCNSILNVAGGHPDIPPTDVNVFAGITAYHMGMAMTNYSGKKERDYALSNNSTDAHFVKLTVDRESLLCGKGEIPVYPDDDLKAIFGFAENRNMPVVCHCLTGWGLERMASWPVHSLEHIVSDTVLTDRQVLNIARRKTAVVPTISLGESYLIEEAYNVLPPEYNVEIVQKELLFRREYLREVPEYQCDPVIHAQNMARLSDYKRYAWSDMPAKKVYLARPDAFFGTAITGVRNLRKMRDAGVLIGVGMDAGLPFSYFGSLYREMEMLQRIGFSPAEVLACATINNAKILGVEDRLGTLEDGKCADIVALNQNPLDDMAATRQPSAVFKEGRLVHSNREWKRDADGMMRATGIAA
ncbi:MAG: amidohydrolase family protein [Deltaproteobacteria bacterium]|nr:amidohydrolase family protein [Deltaproteobacteria bacterium]